MPCAKRPLIELSAPSAVQTRLGFFPTERKKQNRIERNIATRGRWIAMDPKAAFVHRNKRQLGEVLKPRRDPHEILVGKLREEAFLWRSGVSTEVGFHRGYSRPVGIEKTYL